MVFIGEFSIHTSMTRTRARPPKGERAEVVEPFNHMSNISVIGSLSLNGVDAVMRIEGAVNAQVFDAIENRRKPPPEKMCPGIRL